MQVDNSLTCDRCPLCEAKEIHLEGKLNYGGEVNFSSSAIALSRVPELWTCRQCLSGFVQHAVDAETAKLLYTNSRSGERWGAESFSQAKTPEVVGMMDGLFKCKGRVLDVGCNTGELLDFARACGCVTSGVEPSSASRAVLDAKGHKSYTSIEEAEGEYDVITAFDLIEHLYDVPAFMQACRSKLVPGGRLAILTGDLHSLSAKLAGVHWWYAQYPEHIVFPSRRYFSDYTGFRIESWVPTYASNGYKQPLHKTMLGLLKSVLLCRPYIGLPSLGPDHVVVVLS